MRRTPPPCRRVGSRSVALLIGAVLSCSGCATYRLGSDTLYRPDIRTVAVPVFQSESLRRQLGERLTEAVAKQVELKTPYKLVDTAGAETVLLGRLVSETKYAILENANDELRDIEVEMSVEVAWRDRMGNDLMPPQLLPLSPTLTTLGRAVHFVPEGGQSMATAQQEAIERLAEQIVAGMEVPW